MSFKDVPPLQFREIEGRVIEGEDSIRYVSMTDHFPSAFIVLDEAEAEAVRDWLNQVLG
jgi:hypothetical protein